MQISAVMDSLLLFVHIPKTAGTSFRGGLMQLFARCDVLFDYGPVAPETDQYIKLLYEEKPFNVKQVAEFVNAKGIKLLCGHFPYGRYGQTFPDARVVSFVREPLQRCYAEFLHLQRNKKYTKSFVEFFEQPWLINLQSKWLAAVSDDVLIGVSEHYGHSVKMINKTLGFSVPTMFLNMHRKNIDEPYSLDEIGQEAVEKFYALNQEDVLLYQDISSRLLQDFEEIPFFLRSLRRVKNKLRSCTSTTFK